jgi:hypothetical protein
MTTLARTISRAFPATSPQLEILTQLAMFCGAGIFVWLLTEAYGLDLSLGFF